jgi:hypothetical protein
MRCGRSMRRRLRKRRRSQLSQPGTMQSGRWPRTEPPSRPLRRAGSGTCSVQTPCASAPLPGACLHRTPSAISCGALFHRTDRSQEQRQLIFSVSFMHRVGDDDPRAGPSSMQRFAGEDLQVGAAAHQMLCSLPTFGRFRHDPAASEAPALLRRQHSAGLRWVPPTSGTGRRSTQRTSHVRQPVERLAL